MSRINYVERKEFTPIEKPITKNIPIAYDHSPRVHIIDADSIIFMGQYKTEDDIEEAKFRIRTMIQDISTTVEAHFNIVKTLMFIGGKNNFRYKLFPEYKANRPPKPPHIISLLEWVSTEYNNCIVSNFAEADDYIYTAWKVSDQNCVVSFIDKDLLSFLHSCPLYNYKKNEFISITEAEATLNFRCQLLQGDNGDNVKLNKGTGDAYCKKVLYLGMSEIAFRKELIKLYRKNYGLAYKEKIRLAHNLLKLHHVNDIKDIN